MIRLTMRGRAPQSNSVLISHGRRFLASMMSEIGRGLLYFSNDNGGRIAVQAHQIRIADKASDLSVCVAQSQMVDMHLFHFENCLEDRGAIRKRNDRRAHDRMHRLG